MVWDGAPDWSYSYFILFHFSVACSKTQNIQYQRGIKGLIHLWIISLTQSPTKPNLAKSLNLYITSFHEILLITCLVLGGWAVLFTPWKYIFLITKFACFETFPYWLESSCVWGGGIFTVKMSNFSGKSAEKVMGVNEFDCPAIFLGAGALNFLGVIDDMLEH